MSSHGYIVIPNWNRFQHYKDRQPAWIKMHLELLGNDAWLELSTPDRCLLMTIWMLTGRYGNGRLKADERWLKSQAKAHKSSLARLNHAGFIQFCDSPVMRTLDSLEGEGSKEPKNKKESAASSARHNGAAAAHKKQVEAAVAQAIAWQQQGDPALEQTITEAWPDLATEIIRRLPAAKETA